ncbi:MAG: GNAT family N-acetyltransferase, partial [Alphaproteobacteria bacterium]
MKIDICNETPSDIEPISRLTNQAFSKDPENNTAESIILTQLRDQGDLSLSLVAKSYTKIVGHVAFSEVKIESETGTWFGLGPISVAPDQQHKGIGSKLVESGLEHIKSKGASGCVLIGDPGYYHRFGLKSDGKLKYGNVPTEYIQWIAFDEASPNGEVSYSNA